MKINYNLSLFFTLTNYVLIRNKHVKKSSALLKSGSYSSLQWGFHLLHLTEFVFFSAGSWGGWYAYFLPAMSARLFLPLKKTASEDQTQTFVFCSVFLECSSASLCLLTICTSQYPLCKVVLKCLSHMALMTINIYADLWETGMKVTTVYMPGFVPTVQKSEYFALEIFLINKEQN